MTRYPKGPRLRVQVTDQIITTAVTANSTHCMIADAIKAAYPKATAVAVDVATCRFSDLDEGYRYVFLTPYAAQLALLNFDEGNKPASFSFLLKNAHVTKAGSTERGKARAKRTRGKNRPLPVPAHAVLTSRGEKSSGSLPSRVGGRRPPQLRMMRKFGLRAFRGASLARLQTDAALAARADTIRSKV